MLLSIVFEFRNYSGRFLHLWTLVHIYLIVFYEFKVAPDSKHTAAGLKYNTRYARFAHPWTYKAVIQSCLFRIGNNATDNRSKLYINSNSIKINEMLYTIAMHVCGSWRCVRELVKWFLFCNANMYIHWMNSIIQK